MVKQWKEDMGYAAAVEKKKEGVEQYGGEVGEEEGVEQYGGEVGEEEEREA